MSMEKQAKKSRNSQKDCRCQRCPACIDNARWERIFQEKFADPTYYARKLGRHSSPIADI
jgi:hypothetical protein